VGSFRGVGGGLFALLVDARYMVAATPSFESCSLLKKHNHPLQKSVLTLNGDV
jgi:hypothetical protein